MLFHLLRTEINFITRHLKYFLVNIVSLALGIACLLVIAIWIHYQWSYDNAFPNSSNIYRVEQKLIDQHKKSFIAPTPTPLADVLQTDVPGILLAGRVHFMKNLLFQYNDAHFIEDKVVNADPDFIKIMPLQLLKGNLNNALNDPFSVIISEQTAKKYFGDRDPMGQYFTIDNGLINSKVTGVFKDLPKNSHLDFNIVLPLKLAIMMHREVSPEVWNRFDEIITYVLLDPKADPVQINENIRNIKQNFIPSSRDECYLKPITAIHTDTSIEYDEFSSAKTGKNLIFLFGAVGLMILCIASFNFTNLSTALEFTRIKSFTIRKINGASKSQLSLHILGQTIIAVFLATIIALVLLELAYPYLAVKYNAFSAEFNLWQNKVLILYVLIIFLFTTISAGFYPILFFPKIKPMIGLKNNVAVSGHKFNLSKVVVIFQFVISIMLTLGMLSVYRQTQFMKQFDIGFVRNELLTVPLYMAPGEGILGNAYQSFKNEMLKIPGVTSLTKSSYSPVNIETSAGEADWDGKPLDKTVLVHWNSVNFDYVKTLGLELVSGRSFDESNPGDISGNHTARYILNQAAADAMGVSSPTGINFELYGRKGPVIGVVKNFNYQGLLQPVEPMAMDILPWYNNTLLVRIDRHQTQQALGLITKLWQKYEPNYPFNYHFASVAYNQLYDKESQMANLLLFFTFVTVLISCMGIFSFTLLFFEKRIKEIGIRKVNGATTENIMILLSGDLVKWVLIAFVIAVPIAWHIIGLWLNHYAQHSHLSWWLYVVTGIVALIIALLTIGFRSYTIARKNPLEALRYE